MGKIQVQAYVDNEVYKLLMYESKLKNKSLSSIIAMKAEVPLDELSDESKYEALKKDISKVNERVSNSSHKLDDKIDQLNDLMETIFAGLRIGVHEEIPPKRSNKALMEFKARHNKEKQND